MFVGTWWSLMPPIIAILLALLTKEVYLSLFAGCALGALLVGWTARLRNTIPPRWRTNGMTTG